jgi:hypothetical protein
MDTIILLSAVAWTVVFVGLLRTAWHQAYDPVEEPLFSDD